MITDSIYIDFTTPIKGTPTDFRILKFQSKIFIHISQESDQALLYQDRIYKMLRNKFCRNSYDFYYREGGDINVDFVVYCRLRGDEFLKAVEVLLVDVLNEQVF